MAFSGSSGRQSAALIELAAGVAGTGTAGRVAVRAGVARGVVDVARAGAGLAARAAVAGAADAARVGVAAFWVGARAGAVRVADGVGAGRVWVALDVRTCVVAGTAVLFVADVFVVGAFVTGGVAEGAFAGAFLTGALAGRSLSPIGTTRKGGALD
jgi:hypothetical protein